MRISTLVRLEGYCRRARLRFVKLLVKLRRMRDCFIVFSIVKKQGSNGVTRKSSFPTVVASI